MTAKEAQNLTKRSILEKKQKVEQEESARKKREQENLKWMKEICFPKELVKIDKLVTEQASEGKHNLIYSLDQGDSNGQYMADLLVPELIHRGFKVEHGETYIPEYRGSNDDGYAYAHDSYYQHTLIIKW